MSRLYIDRTIAIPGSLELQRRLGETQTAEKDKQRSFSCRAPPTLELGFGNDDNHFFSVSRDGLWTFVDSEVNDLAQTIFCFLYLPLVRHPTSLARLARMGKAVLVDRTRASR